MKLASGRPRRTGEGMDRFYKAQSIVVIGVSNSPRNLAKNIVFNLNAFGFKGEIYLVGPREETVFGHKVYLGVEHLPKVADLAVILIPAAKAVPVIRQCGEKGIQSIVLESAGFSELAEDRTGLEEEILQILHRFGMRMIGPNCIGVINRRAGLVLPFMPLDVNIPIGKVSIIAQSGGFARAMLDMCPYENIGLSKLASMGNKLDVDEVDLLRYLIEDKETEVVYCHLEDMRRGRALVNVACASPKPIVVQKCNCTKTAAEAAHSHSAALTMDDDVVDGALRQSGILRSRGHRETINMIKAFLLPAMRGNRLAVIARSAGLAVMAADAAEENGFVLPELPSDIIRLLKDKARAGVTQFHNPLDMGDLFDMTLYRTIADNALSRPDIDGVVVDFHYENLLDTPERQQGRDVISRLTELNAIYQKPVAICMSIDLHEVLYHKKRTIYPIFNDAREAVQALAWNRDRNHHCPMALSNERPGDIDTAASRAAFDQAGPGPVPPNLLARMLAAYGIPLIEWTIAHDLEELLAAAGGIGYPVVLKTANPNIIHKSDVGAVAIGIDSEAMLRDAYGRLSGFGAAVLVQKMSSPGLEWFVGGRQDSSFGPVMVTGPGGIFVEIFKETAIRVAPIKHAEAERMIDQLRRASELLNGQRGQPKLDRFALVDILARISWLLHDFPNIGELDINPLQVFPDGCLALDWRAGKTHALDGMGDKARALNGQMKNIN